MRANDFESCTKVEVKKTDHDSGHEDEDFKQGSDDDSDEGENNFTPTIHYQAHSNSNSPKMARRLRRRKKKSDKKEEKEKAEKGAEDEDESDSDEEWSRTREYLQTPAELEPQDGKSKRRVRNPRFALFELTNHDTNLSITLRVLVQ